MKLRKSMKLKISVPLGHQPTSSVLMNEICFNTVLLQIIDINSKVPVNMIKY